MGKRRRILLGFSLVALGVGLGWLLLRPAEPVYGGKPLGYWLRYPRKMPRTHFGWFLGNFKFSSFERANIPGIDLRALPLLIKALESRDTSLDNAYQLLWNKSPQVVQARLAKPVPAVEIRANAAMILAQMEEGARPAIPALVRVLKSDSSDVVRYNAATCLLAIGTGNPTARAALIEVSINDSSAEVRLLAGGVFRPLPIEGEVFPFQPRAEDAPLFVPR